MNAPRHSIRTVLFVMAFTQVVGWGTLSLPAVIGDQLAADIGISLPAVFAGSTVQLVVMGIASLFTSRLYIAYGARPVMAAGALIAALGFVMLALAHEPALYFSAWAIHGIGGAASLSIGPYVLFNEISGSGAKRPIGALMLATGLASSVFWPTTHALSDAFGWRSTMLIYAALALCACFPLYLFGLPKRAAPSTLRPATSSLSSPMSASGKHALIFPLLALSITLCAFVSLGINAVIIQVLRAMGIDGDTAIRLGAMLGIAQVSARLIDFLGGARWNGLQTGVLSAAIMPLGISVLLFGAPSVIAIAGFFLIYGMASGSMAVARATMPLVFYDQADFTRASSRIAFSYNLCAAVAPPLLVVILTRFGSGAVLGFVLAVMLVAFACLVTLAALHRRGRD